MTWTEIEDGLHRVLVAVSGLPGNRIGFAPLAGPAPQTEPYLRIDFPALEPAGSLDLQSSTPGSPPPAGAELTLTSLQRYRITARVHVFGVGAMALAATVGAAFARPSVVSALDDVDLAVTDVRVSRLPALFETRIQDRALVDLALWAWLSHVETASYIEHIYGEGVYSAPGAAPTTLEFGPVP